MALVVNTNVASIQAQYNVNKTNQSMQDAMAALSSGKRINTAGDDAAGLSISTRMEAQVRGLSQAIRNANDGISLVDTAEGAMDEITSMLQRMRELAIQSSNGTLNDQDRANLDAEFIQLQSEIDRVVETTRFNDQILLDGTFSGKALQIGAKSSETVSVAVADLSTASLGTQNSALSSAAAATSVKAEGTAAVENVVNLTFNGNDTYGLTFVLNGASEGAGNATDKEFSISNVVMTGNDATAIAAAINTAVAGNKTDGDGGAELSGIVEANAIGSTVAITVKDGTKLDLSAFTSTGSGSVTVNPVTNSSASSVVLEDVTEQKGLINTGGTVATAAASVLQLDEDKKFQFRVDGTLIEVSGATGDGAANAVAIKNAIDAVSGQNAATVTFTDKGSVHTYEISDATGRQISISGFQKVTSAAVPNGFLTIEQDIATPAPKVIDSGDFLTSDGNTGSAVLKIATGKTGSVAFSNQDLSYTFQLENSAGTAVSYTVDGKDKDFQAELTRVANEITANGGSGISAVNNGGVLEISNTTGSDLEFVDAAVSAPGEAAVTAGNAYFADGNVAGLDVTATGNGIADEAGVVTLLDGSIVSSANGALAVASQMSLDVKGDDRYTFVIDKDNDGGSDATITADVVNGSLAGMVNAINAHSSTTELVATLQNGQVVLTKADGSDFQIKGFAAEGAGKIVAANALGQGGAKTLENDGDGASVSVAASGAAVATEITLQASGADKFSFQITDGVSSAVVRATDVAADAAGDADSLPEMEDLLTEINGALSAANMSHITATNTGDVITLVNSLGGKLEVTNFKSDGTETLTATPKVGQGVGTILNDDALAGASASVSAQSLSTVAGASSAIEVLDRAIENVNDQRSKLGAISNRLDHTVSNLGNIVTNTEASKSRIEDADFAAESANLAKNQILLQAGTAMLAQANASQQTVLSLLG